MFIAYSLTFVQDTTYIVSKIYLGKGMSHYALVAYGHAFGTLATALLAFLFERLINPSL
jgi:hypothetical protein